MYNQGNFAHQYGQAPPGPPGAPGPPGPSYQTGHAPTQLQYQQGPSGVYQQGSIPPPPVVQEGLSASPSSLAHGQSSSLPSALPVCTVPTQTVLVQPPRVVSTIHAYPPPPAHGNASRIPLYTPVQQNPSYSLPVTNQVGQPLPRPPRFIPPPPPSQSQMLYRVPPPPPQSDGAQSLGHCRTLPPPPQIGFDPSGATPSPSFATASMGVALALPPPPPPPPPPPSSPPPLPPSPPSPEPLLPSHDDAVDPFGKPFESAETNTNNIKVLKLSQSTAGAARGCDQDVIEEDRDSSKVENLSSLSLPPVKPVDEEVVRNIEVLCQFIAKVGPDFEDLARSRESGNPKFSFLFGGDPGSTAAIGHEYFKWMKRKCLLELKSPLSSGRREQTLMCSELESSLHSIDPLDKGAMRSPLVLSDMDMEDDFDQAEQDNVTAPLNEGERRESPSLFDSVLRSNEQSHAAVHPHPREEDNDHKSTWPNADTRSSPEDEGTNIQVGSPLKHIQGYASDDSEEEEQKASNDDSSLGVSPSSCLHEDTGISKSNLDATNVQVDEIGTLMFAAEIADVVQCSNGGDAADVSHPLEAAVTGGASCPLETITGGESRPLKTTGGGDFRPLKAVTGGESHPLEAVAGGESRSLEATLGSGGPFSEDEAHSEFRKFKQEGDVNLASVEPKVDEFGRLLREDVTDSDSDDIPYYSRDRHRKGGRKGTRSRSPKRTRWRRRSRSPRRRSRSPRRRRDRRSQSHSRSPRRSKSPDFRSSVQYGGKKVRRDIRGQSQECFNFLKGRCYRGSSCRFLHPVHFKEDHTRHYSSREKQVHWAQQDYGLSASQDTVGACKKSKEISEKVITEVDYLSEEAQKGSSIRTSEKVSVKEIDEKEDVKLAKDYAEPTSKGYDFFFSQIATNQVLEQERNDKLEDPDAPGMISSVSKPACAFQTSQTETILCTPETSDAIHPPVECLSVSHSMPVSAPESHPLPGDSPVSYPLPVSTPVSHPLPVSVSVSHPVSSSVSHPISSSVSHPIPVSLPVSFPLPDSASVDSASVSQPLPVSALASQPLPVSALASQPLPFSAPGLQPLLVSAPVSQPLLVSAPVSQPLPVSAPVSQPLHISAPVLQPLPVSFSTSYPLPVISTESELLPVCTSVSHPLPVQTFSSPANPVPASTLVSSPNQLPLNSLNHSESLRTRPLPPMEFQTSSFSAAPPPSQPSQPPFRPPGEFQSQSPPREHLQSSAEHSHPQNFPFGRISSYPAPVPDYHFHHVPPRSIWTDLPPPPPPPPRRETFTQPLIRARPTEELMHSRTSEVHPVHVEAFRPKPAPFDNLQEPPYMVQRFKKEQFPHSFDAHGYHSFHSQLQESQVTPSNSFLPPFARESPFQVHSFPGDSLTHRSFSREDSNIPSRGFSFTSPIGDPGTSESSLFRFSSSLLENLGTKRPTSVHYNPFASTFEQTPTSLKFSSSIFQRETDLNFSRKYDSPFNASHVSGTEQEKTVELVSRSATATSDSSRLGEKLLSKSGESFPVGASIEVEDHVYVREPSAQKQSSKDLETGDQYDPIFDSIEPSSNSLKKLSSASVHDEPKSKRRLSARHRPPDVEETNKQKDDVPAIINPSEKEAFGETDIEEVGDLDNMSAGNPVDNGGEIEIDQVQFSPEKNKKKSKDSRSMKLFKVALANFVKEVLKPSWRQGNMSKEAFKTIVKKTVDKVSGAMQGRRIPKTQAKIDQYVESSQRKLTKLIMGYVDKYVKV